MKMSFPKIEGYVVTERLGSGSYSTVYKAHNKVGGRSTVAIKCVDKSRVKHSGSAVDNLITEIRLMKTLTHPHIVKMHDFTWDDKNIYIILEYCSGGDLSKYIRRYGRVPEKQVLYFLQQLASALKFLREKGIAHMDLKPHNLLLHKTTDGTTTLKVADFGFATHMTSSPRGTRGSPLYMAPELMLSDHCSDPSAADLWSVGVIMYECLFGAAPYSSGSLQELIDKIQRKAPILLPPKASISAGCRDLLQALLKHDPQERISYERFLSHEYLDLEHMPTRDNYDKGVSLISRAIERDTAGQYGQALSLYSAGLRYLVPRAILYRGNNHQLYVKALNRYMERAEAIKIHLQQRDNTSAGHLVQTDTVSEPADTEADLTQEHCTECPTLPNDKRSEQSRSTKQKSTLSRLFSRQPLPAIDDNLAYNQNVPQVDKSKRDDDTCRIT